MHSNSVLPRLRGISLAILAVTTTNSYAAGFALIEQSVTGMGNAFAGAAAVANDESTVFFNPAGLTRLSGTRLGLAAHIVAPSAKFGDTGSAINLALGTAPLFGTDGSDGGKTGFPPNLYYARSLTDNLRFGLGINAPFGLATEYSDHWRGRYHAIKSELMTVNVNPAIAFKASEQLSIGFGISAQYIDAKLSSAIDTGTACASVAGAGACGAGGLTPLQSDGKQVLEGDDWSFGFNVGLLYDLTDTTRVGFAYRSKVIHKLEGDVDFSMPAALSAPAFAAIAANFADTGVTADIDLPETASLSVYHKTSEKIAILADATFTRWSRFNELRIKFDNGNPDSVQPEEWDNSMRYALGMNYYAHPEWTLRAGVAYDETPIPSAQLRTPRIPGNNRRWATFGFSHQPNPGFRFDFGYAHLFVSDTPINNTEEVTGHILTGVYEHSVDIFSAGMTWQF